MQYVQAEDGMESSMETLPMEKESQPNVDDVSLRFSVVVNIDARQPANAKLTDDEERANGGRFGPPA
jgi:hypothetical protein